MPIYEYECSACSHRLESFQKMTDMPLVTCPNCHRNSLEKLISAAGFQLKGSGWYATDFRNKGKPPAEKKEGGTEGGTSAETKKPTDSKPDTKSATGTVTT